MLGFTLCLVREPHAMWLTRNDYRKQLSGCAPMGQHLSGKVHKKRCQAVLQHQVAPPLHLRELGYERWWCAGCNSPVDSAIAMLLHCTGRAHERAVLLPHRMNDTYSLTNLEDAMTRAKESFTRNGGHMIEFSIFPTHISCPPLCS